jgi:hypothetical protein
VRAGAKKPAQARRGIVERGRGLAQIVRARELDEAIAQILALEEDEDHEDRDNAGRSQRPQQRRDQRRDALQRRRRRLAHLNRYGA